MEQIVRDFGNYIREKRIQKGLSQAEVARLLGINQVSYGRYELGTRDAGLNMILKIADVLDFTPSDFFNRYIG